MVKTVSLPSGAQGCVVDCGGVGSSCALLSISGIGPMELA